MRNYIGKDIYLVGIKGTGMSALAELLADSGANVSGSDTDEKFYTDEILDRLEDVKKELRFEFEPVV